jgi:hypothetical protein
MKVILQKVIRKKVETLIKRLGGSMLELLIEMPLSFSMCNSIEYNEKDNRIYIHIFDEDDFDLICDFDDIDEEDKLKVYQILSSFL